MKWNQVVSHQPFWKWQCFRDSNSFETQECERMQPPHTSIPRPHHHHQRPFGEGSIKDGESLITSTSALKLKSFWPIFAIMSFHLLILQTGWRLLPGALTQASKNPNRYSKKGKTYLPPLCHIQLSLYDTPAQLYFILATHWPALEGHWTSQWADQTTKALHRVAWDGAQAANFQSFLSDANTEPKWRTTALTEPEKFYQNCNIEIQNQLT